MASERPRHFPHLAPIDTYGNGGFRFAGMSHRGSLICVPSGIYAWQAPAPGAIDGQSLSLVLDEAEAIEILLIGTGREIMPLGRDLRAEIKEAGMSADAMSTGAAVRTLNVLLAEERAVAAALIAVD